MKILLDENFPLPLYHRLRAAGFDADHIILLGQRGMSDDRIRGRLAAERLLFLTQDGEFADRPPDCRATIIISRVRQSRLIEERVSLWLAAIEQSRPPESLFEILDSGELVPWTVFDIDPSTVPAD